MQYDDALKQVTEGVFTSMIGPVPEPVDPETPDPEGYSAVVRISGDWKGAVTVRGSATLAKRAASVMFGSTPEETGDAEARDAFGEIGNMISGSVKALLPGECALSIPCVGGGADGGLSAPGETVGRAAFDVEGERLCVTMVCG